MAVTPALSQDQKSVGDNAAEDAEANQRVADSRREFDRLFWQGHQADPEAYRTVCEKPQNRADAGLCQQWRMAEATKDQADLAFKLFVATIIEIFALIGVLILTIYSLAIARTATKAAVAANTIARETAHQELRAYVTVESINLDNVGDNYAYKILWKNTGGSPAVRTKTYTNWCAVTGGELPPDFDYARTGENATHNDEAGLGAGQHTDSWPVFIPFQTIQRARHNIQNIYVWGAAEYSEVFKGTPRRRTEFCYHFTVDVQGDKIGFGQRIYGPHNGIDETCYYKPQEE